MSPLKVMLDTDLLIAHLLGDELAAGSGRGSVVRRVMSVAFCYTTVFNAAEMFSIAETEGERRAVEEGLQAVKILGLGGRSARNVGLLMTRTRRKNIPDLTTLIAAVCIESRLPLISGRPARFRGIPQLQIVSAVRLRKCRSSAELKSVFEAAMA